MAKQSIGKRLNRARLELGMTVPQLRDKILQDHLWPVGASTIRDIEADKTPNPGFKTLESIALGCGLPPLDVIALGLADPPELEAGYTETQFAQLARVYKKVGKEYRPVADELVKMLIEKMQRWR